MYFHSRWEYAKPLWKSALLLDSIVCTENVGHILGDNNPVQIHGNNIPVHEIVGDNYIWLGILRFTLYYFGVFLVMLCAFSALYFLPLKNHFGTQINGIWTIVSDFSWRRTKLLIKVIEKVHPVEWDVTINRKRYRVNI